MTAGLMSSFHQEKKQFFIASDPERLLEIISEQHKALESRQEALTKLLPQLKAFNNKQKDRPVVHYYEGKEGIKSMVNEVFRSAKDVVRMVYSVDAIRGVFSEEDCAGCAK